jgi:membrane protein
LRLGTHPFFLSKARNLLTTIACSAMLLISLAMTAVVEVARRTPLLERIDLDSDVLSRPVGVMTNFVLALLMFALLYKITPYVRTRWTDVLAGAAIAAVLFEIGKAVFVIYLDRGTDFEAVYGSLSSIVVLLLWLYFSAWVLIFGAEYNIVRYQEGVKSSSDTSSEPEAAA